MEDRSFHQKFDHRSMYLEMEGRSMYKHSHDRSTLKIREIGLRLLSCVLLILMIAGMKNLSVFNRFDGRSK